jgi:hypothetical protein
MTRLIRALLVTSAATAAAYVVWSRLATPTGTGKVKLVPPVKEVDIDSLPEDVRKELLSELDEQLQ